MLQFLSCRSIWRHFHLRHNTKNAIATIKVNLQSQIHMSHTRHKIVPSNLRGKSKSSQEWLTRQLNDPYVKRARYDNYRARSAYKLLEIDDKHNILRPGMIVIECGAAPGSWTQVLVKRLKLEGDLPFKTGAVISIDISAFNPVQGAITMPRTDFTKPLNQGKILHALDGKLVDLVCSDMAPNAMGLKEFDHDGIMGLCYSAFHFALNVLKPPEGAFLTKILEGNKTIQFIQDCNRFFDDVIIIKPDASRGDSTEAYVLARRFKGVRK